MRRRVTFERPEVGDDLPRVVAEDRAAGDPKQGAEEEPARIAAEGALPRHLDPAATLRWRRGELPAAARVAVDVGAQYTGLFNAAGVPGTAQPVRVAGSRVPASLQLVGPLRGEELLLATAQRIEAMA
jgi:hypothetical protein